MNVVCTHSLGLPCPYCGATRPVNGTPCAVIARIIPGQEINHALLFVGGARRHIGPAHLVDRVAAQHGYTVDWAQPKQISDGRTSWPLHPLTPTEAAA